MARVSFSLRRDPTRPGELVGVGSYNRGTSDLQTQAGASAVDQDSAIRSDGIIVDLPIDVDSSFSAYAVDHTTVKLEWVLTETFTAVADVPSGQTRLIGVSIVYSPAGYPETVADGRMLYNSIESPTLSPTVLHTATERTFYEPPQGRWAYYTLFGYYNENGLNGTYYYNKLASLEVLVPTDYGSARSLWERIPKYYRELDNQNNSYLERFLDVFGFETDRTKTLIDAVMTQYDPMLADAEAVNQLANMLGLEATVDQIGVSRTRSLLHDIGYLRRRKGTVDSIKGYLTAVSGGAVEVKVSGSAPYYTFYINSQRCNLIANPRLSGSAGSNWNITASPAVTVDDTAPFGVTLTSGASASVVSLRSMVGVPVKQGISYYMSVEFSGTKPTVYTPTFQTAASVVPVPPAQPATEYAYASYSTYVAYTSSVAGASTTRYAYEGIPAATGIRYPMLTFSLPANTSVTINKWMLEPYTYGSFFDGDSAFGGFLYRNQSADYLWSGAARDSYSTYTANRVKVNRALEDLLPKILPVTLLGGSPAKYAVFYDQVPGMA